MVNLQSKELSIIEECVYLPHFFFHHVKYCFNLSINSNTFYF